MAGYGTIGSGGDEFRMFQIKRFAVSSTDPKLLGAGILLLSFLLLASASLAQVNNVIPDTGTLSPLSPESPVNNPNDYAQYQAYNDGYIEHDLWRIEQTKFFRSRCVLSPDKQSMAYTEVVFMPDTRQTFSKLYEVRLASVNGNEPALPPLVGSGKAPPNPPRPRSFYENRFDPDQYLKQRQTIAALGHDKTVGYEFRTLTIIDWSFTGNRLLFKQKSGVLHIGLKTTDILVYDRKKGNVTIFPEIQRTLSHYWNNTGTLPALETIAWDIYPLGWVPGSDSLVLFKGWAFDKKNKKFLGVWQYDFDNERAELVSLKDQPVTVAANGTLAKPDLKTFPKEPKKKKAKKKKKKDDDTEQL